MDFNKNQQEIVSESATATSVNHQSTTTSRDLSATNETSSCETHQIQSFNAPVSILPLSSDAVKSTSISAETSGDQTVSTPIGDAEGLQPGALLSPRIKSTLHDFEPLHDEILTRIETMNKVNKDHDGSTIDRLLQSVQLGTEELQLMLEMRSYVRSSEAELLKQKAEIDRMTEENAWLRDELARTQQQLQLSEQRCATLDVEKSQLQFLSDLQKYDAEATDMAEDLDTMESDSPYGNAETCVAEDAAGAIDVANGIETARGRPGKRGRTGNGIEDMQTDPPPPKKWKKSAGSGGRGDMTAMQTLNQMLSRLCTCVRQTGPSHQPIFTAQIRLDGQVFEGVAPSKKQAMHAAATQALQVLGCPTGRPDKAAIETSTTGNTSSTSKVATAPADRVRAAVSAGMNPVMIVNNVYPGALYKLVSARGVGANRNFIMSLSVERQTFHGSGSSKRLAKAYAAQAALFGLHNVRSSFTGE